MTLRSSLWATVLVATPLILQACSPRQAMVRGDRIRSIPSMQATHHHRPITMQVGWIPYSEWTSSDSLAASRGEVTTDSIRFSEMPAIFVTYPDSADSFWLDPSIDDALLGRLIKHTLMTQQPITRPFDEYLLRATCQPCHPDRIPLPNDK